MAKFGGADAPAGTAQELFQHVIRDSLGPTMRDLGFGEGRYGFGLQRGDYEASVITQKSRHSTRQEIDFWINLSAYHKPTKTVYWRRQLQWLIPETSAPWTVTVGKPIEPVAASVLDAFVRYGWPAIEAALPPHAAPLDPQGWWARTTPPQGDSRYQAGPPSLESIAWALAPAGRPADAMFAKLDDQDPFNRDSALEKIAERAADDPRAVPVLLDRLQHDPSPGVRESAAGLLRARASNTTVRELLGVAGENDPDSLVRWAARYALRLAADPQAVWTAKIEIEIETADPELKLKILSTIESWRGTVRTTVNQHDRWRTTGVLSRRYQTRSHRC
jgi:hypothetical protein